MGRQLKVGLDYFSLDVGLFSDKKIKSLRAHFGADGIAFYLYILCEVYKDQGYYVQADADFLDNAASDLGMGPEKIGQMLHFLLERSLLDSILFQSDKVLTSHGIQMRYQLAKKSMGQKTVIPVVKEFWILTEEETQSFIEVRQKADFSRKNPDCSRKKTDCSGNNPPKERKRKETKRNERKGGAAEKSAPSAQPAAPEWVRQLPLPLPPNAEKEIAFYLQKGLTQALIEWAAMETVSRGKPWGYFRGILKAKLEEGIFDVAQKQPGRKKTGSSWESPPSYDIEGFEQQGFSLPEGWENEQGD